MRVRVAASHKVAIAGGLIAIGSRLFSVGGGLITVSCRLVEIRQRLIAINKLLIVREDVRNRSFAWYWIASHDRSLP